jgi:hypothetical protein
VRATSDLVGQFDIGQTAVGLQLSHDAAINLIKVQIWHIT